MAKVNLWELPFSNLTCPLCGETLRFRTVESKRKMQYLILRCAYCGMKIDKRIHNAMSISDVDGVCVVSFDKKVYEAEKKAYKAAIKKALKEKLKAKTK